MEYIVCILLGYLLGTVNFAYIIGRIKGFDIRTKGSTNAGASNATVTMGWGIGILVALCDVAKAFAAVIIAKGVFKDLELAGVVAGIACILGHIFPFYMNFKGGKGFASYMGMILALDWKFFLILAGLTIIITIVTNYIALATLTTVVAYPIYLIFTKIEIIVPLIVTILSIIMVFKHIPNIQRIINGQEIGLRRSKKI